MLSFIFVHTLTIFTSPAFFLIEKTNGKEEQHFDLHVSPLHLYGIKPMFTSFGYNTVNCDISFMEVMKECSNYLTERFLWIPSLQDGVKTGDALVDSEI